MAEDLVNKSWLGLDEKVCVVTGAGSGIGAEIAAELIRNGASLAQIDRNGAGCEQLKSTFPEQAERIAVFECDIGNEAAVQAVAGQVIERFGRVDGLVNCAGVLRAGGIASVALEDWELVLRTNLTGAMLSARSFAAVMGEAGGSIVHIASVAGHSPQTYSGAYSASKAGILLLSKQIAVEYGTSGIRSNAICPGMIRTALSEPFYQQPGIKEQREALTASKRIGTPSDIAHAAAFLLSERADYINGAELVVDGGMEGMLMHIVPRPGFTAGEDVPQRPTA